MTAWYNEIDAKKAQWLRNLIDEGLIAHGVVDERSISEVRPGDLAGFAQCHFFAGVGIWSLCLRRSGWPDDRPIWTGSCPCGPFSIAGKRAGFADPRHLWPEWFRLISERRPLQLFGEQSDQASAWLDLVSSDLEGIGYAIGAVDLPAAGFGGAHRRQRLGFVADADNAQWWSDRAPWHDGRWPQTGRLQGSGHAGECGAIGVGQADTKNMHGRSGIGGTKEGARPTELGRGRSRGSGSVHGVALGDTGRQGLSDAQLGIVRQQGWWPAGGAVEQPGDPSRPGADWLLCRDSKWRPVEPGTCPLVDAHPTRVVELRAYGDAIDVEAFTALISSYMDAAP